MVMTSIELSGVKDSLISIKNMLANQQEDVGMILLSDNTNAIPILSLTLAFPELVPTSITIFLALSFLTQSIQADQFTCLM